MVKVSFNRKEELTVLITEIYTPDKVALAAKELQLGELVAFPTGKQFMD